MINDIRPIGIETYNLDLVNEEKILEGLLYSFERGKNYISTSLMYSNCEIVDFFVMSYLEKYIES